MGSIIKKPSAWIPIVLSLIAIASWCIGLAAVGVPGPQPDEGTGAHLFQIWLVLEAFLILFFAVKWLPQKPGQALWTLALQIAAALIACAPVYYLKL